MIVAANNYKKKINASQTDLSSSNAAYGQQNMNMQQQMSQKMPQQQHGLLPPLQQNALQHQRSPLQQNLTSPQQLSPMSLQFQNDVVNDVVRSLDELLATSSITDKNKYLAIPDRIPLPPQYESTLVPHQMPMASKFHSEYTNGHSTNVYMAILIAFQNINLNFSFLCDFSTNVECTWKNRYPCRQIFEDTKWKGCRLCRLT